MRVLLRNPKTGLCLAGRDRWVEQAEGQDFVTAARAITFAFEARLKDVEVLLCFDDPRFDIRLPIKSHPE